MQEVYSRRRNKRLDLLILMSLSYAMFLLSITSNESCAGFQRLQQSFVSPHVQQPPLSELKPLCCSGHRSLGGVVNSVLSVLYQWC